MSCDERHCITCADEAIETRLLYVLPNGHALSDAGEVLTDLVAPVHAGDVVLVHAGVAIAKVER